MDSTLIQKLVECIVQRTWPERVILFGSRARGDADEKSDFDIAVEGSGATIQQWHQLLEKLQEATLLSVDLLRMEEASPKLKERISREGIVLYDKRKNQVEFSQTSSGH